MGRAVRHLRRRGKRDVHAVGRRQDPDLPRERRAADEHLHDPALAGRAYCSVHNGMYIPVTAATSAAAGYGGTSVVDLTNPSTPHESPITTPGAAAARADTWSSYWYNGAIYANDMTRGIDAFNVIGAGSNAATWSHLERADAGEPRAAFPIPGPGTG